MGKQKIGSQNGQNVNNYQIGTPGNDRLEGKTTPGTDFLIGLGGKDVLVGADGSDHFLLGKTANAEDEDIKIPGETGKEVFYDEAGNDDYALISKFDRGQDFIELAGAKSDYTLGAAPSGLPEGTGIFKGNELIGIVEGQNDITLDAPYFQSSL